jgi:hypothetical protein
VSLIIMPCNIQFTDSVGAVVPLTTVEDEFLARIGEPPVYIKWLGDSSAQFEILCINGIACTKDGSFDETVFAMIYQDRHKHSAAHELIARDFLNGRYRFAAWR